MEGRRSGAEPYFGVYVKCGNTHGPFGSPRVGGDVMRTARGHRRTKSDPVIPNILIGAQSQPWSHSTPSSRRGIAHFSTQAQISRRPKHWRSRSLASDVAAILEDNSSRRPMCSVELQELAMEALHRPISIRRMGSRSISETVSELGVVMCGGTGRSGGLRPNDWPKASLLGGGVQKRHGGDLGSDANPGVGGTSVGLDEAKVPFEVKIHSPAFVSRGLCDTPSISIAKGGSVQSATSLNPARLSTPVGGASAGAGSSSPGRYGGSSGRPATSPRAQIHDKVPPALVPRLGQRRQSESTVADQLVLEGVSAQTNDDDEGGGGDSVCAGGSVCSG
ncbi:unnamed protein product, partial [Discosporangium mesarthrocarpum]